MRFIRDIGNIIGFAGICVMAGAVAMAPFASFGHDHHECPASCCFDRHEDCCDGGEAECTGIPPCDACEAVFVQNATTVVSCSDHFVRRAAERCPAFLMPFFARDSFRGTPMTALAFFDPPAGFGQSPPGFSGTVLRL